MLVTCGRVCWAVGRKRKDGACEDGSVLKRQAKEGVVGSGRRVAQNIEYNERKLAPPLTEHEIISTVFPQCATEKDALEQTGNSTIKRLYEVELCDECDQLQPIDQQTVLFIRGVIQPIDGRPTKKTGRRVARFGPLISWTVLYQKQATIEIQTEQAEYHCMSPSTKYRFLFHHLQEQVQICHEVYEVLKLDPTFSMDTVLQHLQRSKVKHGFRTWREALCSNSAFISKQLYQMSHQSSIKGLRFEETCFASQLAEEYSHLIDPLHIAFSIPGVEKLEDSQKRILTSDEQLARQLQAKEDAKQLHYQSREKGVVGSYALVHEEDIADDYPLPMAYEKLEEETDEFLMADEDVFLLQPEDLPQRTLTEFAFYNSEGLFASLELLPSWSGDTKSVADLYGSGIVGEEATDLELDLLQKTTGEGMSGGGSSSAGVCHELNPCSMWIYLSQIQEYVVECLMEEKIFIWIRTEACWYRLLQPSFSYTRWFSVLEKCALIAIKIITMILKEARASKLSLTDVVTSLSKEKQGTSKTFISNDVVEVKRFLVAHGQLLLNQFLNYPDHRIQNCSFFLQLRELRETMNNCRSQLAPKRDFKKPPKTTINKNPIKDRVTSVRVKALPASATILVQKIWKNYFSVKEIEKEEMLQGEEEGIVEDLDFTEMETNLEKLNIHGGHEKTRESSMRQLSQDYIDHRGVVVYRDTAEQETQVHRVFKEIEEKGGIRVKAGDVVCYNRGCLSSETASESGLGLLQCFLQHKITNAFFVQLRKVIRGEDTVLGDAASRNELFLENKWIMLRINDISKPLKNFKVKGTPVQKLVQEQEYIIKLIYKPKSGMFETIRDLNLGLFHKKETEEKKSETEILENGDLKKNNVVYSVGDTICFLDPCTTTSQKVQATCKRAHKGSLEGMKPYGIGTIIQFILPRKKKDGDVTIQIQLYYRPEDISEELEEVSDYWEIYQSNDVIDIKSSSLVQKCHVSSNRSKDSTETFICTKHVKEDTSNDKFIVEMSPTGQEPCNPQCNDTSMPKKALKTLDMFAGCGGLSEGLHQTGIVNTQWAIEYDEAAADAFKLNHPSTSVFCSNVSALLWKVMAAHGQEQDCIAANEVQIEAKSISEERACEMPKPGEVDFIVGGPPCQGYSGMNRFNKSKWSMTQNSMVMNFLSFVDYYRPKYFLLENVRNFVSHNSSQTFRLTIRTLIEMGFQVRFGVLNAGNYGVPQSRKRTFIWAASEDEILPEWPKPLHVFHSPQLAIHLAGGIRYAVHEDMRGALLRTVTVQDAISDLPSIENGSNVVAQDYLFKAKSHFQRKIRGNCEVLRDHISKKLNDINLERCCSIPKSVPGADWRFLLEIVKNDPSKATYKGQPLVPWCLPNTAARHNNWRGLFGRLDRKGHFPTSTTDPQPMGKVGQVFHPDQDRIVSVRECARSQGFPDTYQFHGSIHQKHKQVGNAVPPPLAFALGNCLKHVLRVKESDEE